MKEFSFDSLIFGLSKNSPKEMFKWLLACEVNYKPNEYTLYVSCNVTKEGRVMIHTKKITSPNYRTIPFYGMNKKEYDDLIRELDELSYGLYSVSLMELII